MKDINLPLQHDFSLKRLSLIVLIANIYEDPVIKHYLKEEILIDYVNRSSLFFYTLEIEIVRLASGRVKSLAMPNSLVLEAINIAIILGKKIAKWAEYVFYTLSLDTSYFDEIHWTYFGTIDEAKTYRAYRMRHGNFDNNLNNDENLIMKIDDGSYNFALALACTGNEKAILYYQDAIIKEVETYLGVNLPNMKNKVDQIAAAYACFLHGENYDKRKQKNIFEKFKQTGKVSISEVIFTNEDTVKFFWKFLNNSEKENVIIELALDSFNYDDALDCSGIDTCELSNENDNAAEIVLFLINQMTLKQRNEFLREHVTAVFHLFLHVWPYQEICIKLLDEELVQETISNDGEDLLNILLCYMAQDFIDTYVAPEACLQKTVFHKLLEKVFSLVPKVTKDRVLFDEDYYKMEDLIFPDAIKKFYKIFDVNSLSIIINDNDLKEKMADLIYMGSWKILKLMETKEIKLLVCFIKRVLIDKNERKKFIRNWDLENHPLVADNPDIREKISTWLKA